MTYSSRTSSKLRRRQTELLMRYGSYGRAARLGMGGGSVATVRAGVAGAGPVGGASAVVAVVACGMLRVSLIRFWKVAWEVA